MDYVAVEKQPSGASYIIMNRPKVHNAFNDQMIIELLQAFQQADNDADCRVVVLQAQGKNFSAGADLNWMKSMAQLDFHQNKADSDQLAKLMHCVYSLSKPVIAQVQGASYGGALGLIAACDIAVAESNATFCLSEVKIGLVPAVISPYVIEAMGVRNARRYILSAEVFTANEAKAFGLLHEVTTEECLEGQINALVKQISANGPNAVTKAKQLVQKVANKPIGHEIIEYTSELIAQVRVSEEGQEGLEAFLEKRKPGWK